MEDYSIYSIQSLSSTDCCNWHLCDLHRQLESASVSDSLGLQLQAQQILQQLENADLTLRKLQLNRALELLIEASSQSGRFHCPIVNGLIASVYYHLGYFHRSLMVFNLIDEWNDTPKNSDHADTVLIRYSLPEPGFSLYAANAAIKLQLFNPAKHYYRQAIEYSQSFIKHRIATPSQLHQLMKSALHGLNSIKNRAQLEENAEELWQRAHTAYQNQKLYNKPFEAELAELYHPIYSLEQRMIMNEESDISQMLALYTEYYELLQSSNYSKLCCTKRYVEVLPPLIDYTIRASPQLSNWTESKVVEMRANLNRLIIELQPNECDSYRLYSEFEFRLGNTAESIRLAELAIDCVKYELIEQLEHFENVISDNNDNNSIKIKIVFDNLDCRPLLAQSALLRDLEDYYSRIRSIQTDDNSTVIECIDFHFENRSLVWKLSEFRLQFELAVECICTMPTDFSRSSQMHRRIQLIQSQVISPKILHRLNAVIHSLTPSLEVKTHSQEEFQSSMQQFTDLLKGDPIEDWNLESAELAVAQLIQYIKQPNILSMIEDYFKFNRIQPQSLSLTGINLGDCVQETEFQFILLELMAAIQSAKNSANNILDSQWQAQYPISAAQLNYFRSHTIYHKFKSSEFVESGNCCNPDDDRDCYNEGSAWNALKSVEFNHFRSAERYLTRADETQPDCPLVFVIRLEYYMKTNQYFSALQHLRSSQQKLQCTNHPFILLQSGNLYTALGQYDQALIYYKQLYEHIKEVPDFRKSHSTNLLDSLYSYPFVYCSMTSVMHAIDQTLVHQHEQLASNTLLKEIQLQFRSQSKSSRHNNNSVESSIVGNNNSAGYVLTLSEYQQNLFPALQSARELESRGEYVESRRFFVKVFNYCLQYALEHTKLFKEAALGILSTEWSLTLCKWFDLNDAEKNDINSVSDQAIVLLNKYHWLDYRIHLKAHKLYSCRHYQFSVAQRQLRIRPTDRTRMNARSNERMRLIQSERAARSTVEAAKFTLELSSKSAGVLNHELFERMVDLCEANECAQYSAAELLKHQTDIRSNSFKPISERDVLYLMVLMDLLIKSHSFEYLIYRPSIKIRSFILDSDAVGQLEGIIWSLNYQSSNNEAEFLVTAYINYLNRSQVQKELNEYFEIETKNNNVFHATQSTPNERQKLNQLLLSLIVKVQSLTKDKSLDYSEYPKLLALINKYRSIQRKIDEELENQAAKRKLANDPVIKESRQRQAEEEESRAQLYEESYGIKIIALCNSTACYRLKSHHIRATDHCTSIECSSDHDLLYYHTQCYNHDNNSSLQSQKLFDEYFDKDSIIESNQSRSLKLGSACPSSGNSCTGVVKSVQHIIGDDLNKIPKLMKLSKRQRMRLLSEQKQEESTNTVKNSDSDSSSDDNKVTNTTLHLSIDAASIPEVGNTAVIPDPVELNSCQSKRARKRTEARARKLNQAKLANKESDRQAEIAQRQRLAKQQQQSSEQKINLTQSEIELFLQTAAVKPLQSETSFKIEDDNIINLNCTINSIESGSSNNSSRNSFTNSIQSQAQQNKRKEIKTKVKRQIKHHLDEFHSIMVQKQSESELIQLHEDRQLMAIQQLQSQSINREDVITSSGNSDLVSSSFQSIPETIASTQFIIQPDLDTNTEPSTLCVGEPEPGPESESKSTFPAYSNEGQVELELEPGYEVQLEPEYPYYIWFVTRYLPDKLANIRLEQRLNPFIHSFRPD